MFKFLIASLFAIALAVSPAAADCRDFSDQTACNDGNCVWMTNSISVDLQLDPVDLVGQAEKTKNKCVKLRCGMIDREDGCEAKGCIWDSEEETCERLKCRSFATQNECVDAGPEGTCEWNARRQKCKKARL
jgi:hypothetical protein